MIAFLSKNNRIVPSLLAHLRRLSPARPAENICPCSTKAKFLCTSRKLARPFSIRPIKAPFFPLSFESVWKVLAFFPEVSSSGFGYPLEDRYSLISGSLFQLPTLLGFSLQSLSPPVNQKESFPSLPPSLRFSTKPFRPGTGASTISPSPIAVLLICFLRD